MVGNTISHYKILDKLGVDSMKKVRRTDTIRFEYIMNLIFLSPTGIRIIKLKE